MTAVRVIQIHGDGSEDVPAMFLRLADRVSCVVCEEHATRATLMTIFRNRAGVSGCCDSLLDRVETAINES